MILEDFSLDKYDGGMIIIYGAGANGYLALKALNDAGIYKNVFFCDKKCQGEIHSGIYVLSPKELTKYREANILVTPIKHIEEICAYLEELRVSHCYSISKLYDEENDFELKNRYNIKLNCYRKKQEGYYPLESLEIRLSKNNKINDIFHLIRDIGYIGFLKIVNDDVDLNQAILRKLVQFLWKKKQVECFMLVFNAKDILEEKTLQCMENANVIVEFSNYEIESEKVKICKNVLRKMKIPYVDFGADEDIPELNNICSNNAEKSQKLYSYCKDKIFGNIFIENKLYLCKFAAYGEKKGLFRNNKEDYVDCNKKIGDFFGKKIDDLLHKKNCLCACRFCNQDWIIEDEFLKL